MTNLSGTHLNNGAAVGPQGGGRDSQSTSPTYPAYKDSGVEWLGEVPEHWAAHPLKRAIERIESGTSVNAADFPAQPGSLGVLKTSCVYTGKFDWAENKTVDDEDLGRVSCPLRKDTLIVSRMNTSDLVGATGLVTEAPNGIFLPDRLWQVYFLENYSPEFIFYFTKSREYREQVKMACSGTSASMQNLGQDDFRGLLFAEPPKPEQTQIARFLDHETACIDALIEEQQRLIELLKEKRQAVISHAVTKGLDPTVPMKDSGVEWLGEVPAHWDVVAIKWLSPVLRGASPRPIDDPKYFDDSGEYAWVRIADVSASDGILRETTQTLSALGASLSVKMEPGEMFLSIAGTVGKPCITQIKACIHDGFVYFPSLSIDNKFLYRIFEVGTCYGGLGKMGTQLNLNTETVGGIQIGVPSNSEIAQILEFIDRQSSVFDSLVGEAVKGVELLQERRSALISAAVTGKIDVRGWQPPVNTQAPESAVAEAN